MTARYKNLIGGEWVDAISGQTFLDINPADRDEILGEFPRSEALDVDRAVQAAQEAFKSGGFKAASQCMTDEYMDKLPVIPGTSIKEIKERLQPFVDAGATRLIIPYVPVTEPVIGDARRFVEAWGATS